MEKPNENMAAPFDPRWPVGPGRFGGCLDQSGNMAIASGKECPRDRSMKPKPIPAPDKITVPATWWHPDYRE